MQYCSTPSPDWVRHRRKNTPEFFEKAATNNSTLYIQVRYVILYHNDTQKIPVNRVQAAHKMLNQAFSASNEEELKAVPNTPRYPWRPLIGNPNIQFLAIKTNRNIKPSM